MIEYDPITGIDDIVERASGPNPFILESDIVSEVDGRGEKVVSDTKDIANPLLASAVTHAVTKSNPASMIAATLVDGHRMGADNPRVKAMEQIQNEQRGRSNIPIPGIGQIPIGDFARSFNKNALQSVVGTGEMLDEFSPATLAGKAAEQRFNPNNLPINPDTGMPMARPLPSITGIKPMPKKSPMPTTQELLQAGIM